VKNSVSEVAFVEAEYSSVSTFGRSRSSRPRVETGHEVAAVDPDLDQGARRHPLFGVVAVLPVGGGQRTGACAAPGRQWPNG